MAVTLCYFNEFGKPAFQLRTTSSSTELTHRTVTVKFVCVTKFTHSRVDAKLPVYRYTLLTFIYRLSFTLPQCFDAWLPVEIFCSHNKHAMLCSVGESSIVFHSTCTTSS